MFSLTLLVCGLSMSGFPFSLVWTHRHTLTHGLTLVLNLDSMAALIPTHTCKRQYGKHTLNALNNRSFRSAVSDRRALISWLDWVIMADLSAALGSHTTSLSENKTSHRCAVKHSCQSPYKRYQHTEQHLCSLEKCSGPWEVKHYYACMYVCMYVCMYIYIYTHTQYIYIFFL